MKNVQKSLTELKEKYEEMARKVGISPLVHNLLNNTNLLNIRKIIIVMLYQKLIVSQIMDPYNKSKNLVKNLEVFHARMTLYRFLRKIARENFLLNLKGTTKDGLKAYEQVELLVLKNQDATFSLNLLQVEEGEDRLFIY